MPYKSKWTEPRIQRLLDDLRDPTLSYREIASRHGVSYERIRQIGEERAPAVMRQRERDALRIRDQRARSPRQRCPTCGTLKAPHLIGNPGTPKPPGFHGRKDG